MQDFWQAFGAISAFLYLLVAIAALYVVYKQLYELVINRKVQTIISIFDTFQSPEARLSRKYIHDVYPISLKELPSEKLEEHLENMWEAIAAFDRIGYFLQRKLIHEDDVVPFLWAMVWRSWKRSEEIIRLMRNKRNDPTYRIRFEYFFEISESYREKNSYEKPKFY